MKALESKSRLLVAPCLAAVVFLLFLGVLDAKPRVALAQTLRDDVSGNIITHTTWALANSP